MEKKVENEMSVLSWDEIVDCIENDIKPSNQVEVEDKVISVNCTNANTNTNTNANANTLNERKENSENEEVQQQGVVCQDLLLNRENKDMKEGVDTDTNKGYYSVNVQETTMTPKRKPWERGV